MWEMKEVYTLDEMLRLYALYRMELDIENGRVAELNGGDKTVWQQ